MPDRRRHRGKHPEDDRLFAEGQHRGLRTAVTEYSWLLTRGYAQASALKLVGDRHSLTARQRMAVMRSACSDQALQRRRDSMVTLSRLNDQPIGIDGYNLLITIESALSGGLILVGRDGCCRDLASIHGTYRKIEETLPAIDLIADYLAGLQIPRLDWYLDRPVSNSGRLKALMAGVLAARGVTLAGETGWNIELVNSPDAVLAAYPGPIVTSDSVVLDRGGPWTNLAAEIINARVPQAWRVDLGQGQA
ncbi:MAG: DUF434 domain-containing protein [Planctomycetota bacterium]|jgi:hypothetical protein